MIGRWKEMKIPDLEQHRGRTLLIIGVRIAFFLSILAITILYQIKLATFFNTESLFPFYTLLITAFLLNSVYLYFFEKTQRLWLPTAFLFVYDTIFITTLILITGMQQSIFLFLYLVNIILCSFVFQRKGAFLIALFTSLSFSVILVFGPELHGQTLYYAVGLNNLAFFSVAALSGYLSEQLNFMGNQLNLRTKDIKALKDINKIIVENINSGLITCTKNYEILLSNKSALKILGLSNITGLTIDEVFSGMKLHIQQMMEKKSKDHNLDSRLERRHVLPGGERLLLGLSISSLMSEDDQVDGYIIIFQDLTEILRLENTVRRQEKLAAVGKLAAGIAHEIRNPLASISGSIELLKDSVQLTTPDQVKLMDIALKEISRLNMFITEFLAFVRPEDRILDVCNVDNILNEVLDMIKLNKTLPQNILQVRDLKSGIFISGDKNKLKQVFLNLVINAYQAMNNRDPAKLTVQTYVEEDVLIVKFRDVGHGMSDQTMKRLFEPFFTTKPKGTGLGLATVHKILEIHDAKIFVESHEGQGTEFTVQFHQVIKQSSHSSGDHNEGQNTGS
ncbi:MAG: ATP-binding protein [Oligoflexia bacterium]|nr:ATP-binding protein [Oligoflexia bacterium]